jgi:hypothetical protein
LRSDSMAICLFGGSSGPSLSHLAEQFERLLSDLPLLKFR